MAAESAQALVARGYTAVKFDPAGPYTIHGGHMPSRHDLELSDRLTGAVRAAVGNSADLLFGTHGQFTAAGAVRLARVIERHDPLWFEEPVAPDDLVGLAAVCRGTGLPVATGERLTTLAEFRQVLEAGAAILQPALGRAGGLWEGRKIAALAQAYGAQVAPHLYAGPVEWAANLHLSATLPNLLVAETIETPFHSALIRDGLAVEDGHVTLSEAPGLGIEVDEDLARAHPWTGGSLHLEMQQDACRYGNENKFQGGAPRK